MILTSPPIHTPIAQPTGLLEPIGGAAGGAAVWPVDPRMSVTLGFAVGATLFTLGDEITCEAHRRDPDEDATLSLTAESMLMMTLDTTLAGAGAGVRAPPVSAAG